MGGKALQDHDVKRLSAEEHRLASIKALAVVNDILSEQGMTPSARLTFSCPDKVDHGDVDLIVPLALREALTIEALLRILAKKFDCEIHHKSYDHMVNITAPHPSGGFYQLDLIFIREEALEFAHAFYSWGDVSTLMLRMASSLRVAIGPNGMSLKVAEGKNVLGRVMLTRDFNTALAYFGLSHERWLQGFSNLDEVYAWVVQAKGFSERSFQLESLPMKVQRDVEKRPGYMGFLEWLKTNKPKRRWFDWRGYLDAMPDSLWQSFPEAKAEYDAIFAERQSQKDAQEKFNGHMISEMTGLNGKALGAFIMDYKKGHDAKSFEKYVLETPLNVLHEGVMKHYEVFVARLNAEGGP